MQAKVAAAIGKSKLVWPKQCSELPVWKEQGKQKRNQTEEKNAWKKRRERERERESEMEYLLMFVYV